MAPSHPHRSPCPPLPPRHLVPADQRLFTFPFLYLCFTVSVCLTCRSAPELYFVLSTFRADPQFMYINISSFSLRIYILLPLLLCPCLAPRPHLEYHPLAQGVQPLNPVIRCHRRH